MAGQVDLFRPEPVIKEFSLTECLSVLIVKWPSIHETFTESHSHFDSDYLFRSDLQSYSFLVGKECRLCDILEFTVVEMTEGGIGASARDAIQKLACVRSHYRSIVSGASQHAQRMTLHAYQSILVHRSSA